MKSGSSSIDDSVVQFHKRYARLSVFVILACAAVFILLEANRFRLKTGRNEAQLHASFIETLAHLDSLLASVTMQVGGLKAVAEHDLDQSEMMVSLAPARTFSSLADNKSRTAFNLDTPKPPFSRDDIGNLTGNGSLAGRPPVFLRELNMALRLNPHFKMVAESLKSVAWVYYTSASQFINIYPWTKSSAFHFNPGLYRHTFYSGGLPKNNPDRHTFWTEVYIDEYGKGLMSTCSAPVYNNGAFLGTVAIDLTVDFLNTAIKGFGRGNGVMFIVNDRGQLVAHPSLTTSQDKAPKSFGDALPELTANQLNQLQNIRELKPHRYGDVMLHKGYLINAPWQVYYVQAREPFFKSLQRNFGLLELVLLGLMPVVLIVMITITNRYFIKPSQLFARFIMARSRHQTGLGHDDVPLPWRPWFDAVSQQFDENEELTRKLDAIFNHTFQFIGLLDRDGILLGVNKTALEFSGVTLQDVIGKPFWQTPWWTHSQEAQEDLKKALARARDGLLARFETTHINHAGNTEIVDFSVNPVKNEDGRVVLLVPEGRIITGIKRIEGELRQAKNEAENANGAKSQFLAVMSHELRTPMNAIIGMTSLAMQINDPQKQQKFLSAAMLSAENLLALLNDVLDFSKMDAGQLELKMARFSLHRFMHDVISAMSPQAEKKGVKLRLTIAPDVPQFYTGDELRLRQILVNLIDNGVKFTEAGSITIQIFREDHHAPSDPTLLHFIVTDTGIGIPAGKISSIFNTFEQLDNSYSRKYGGTGLGLAICRQLTGLMGGKIWVESKEHSGSSFHFIIPLAVSSTSGAETPEGSAASGNSLKGLNILIADDNEVNLDVSSMMLAGDHFVSKATNGLDALNILSEKEFDILFLDIEMPRLGGIEVTRIIRAMEQRLPPPHPLEASLEMALSRNLVAKHQLIVAMTAHSLAQDQDSCMAAGMDYYITKPFKTTQLFKILHDIEASHPGIFSRKAQLGENKMPQTAEGLAPPDVPPKPVLADVVEYFRVTTQLNNEQLEMILPIARQHIAEKIDAAFLALENKDMDGLILAAHTLKGSLLQCGLREWAEKAQEITAGARSNQQLPYAGLLTAIKEGLQDFIVL